MKKNTYETPDSRYIIVRGRLWRKSNPHLSQSERERLVSQLMAARRAVRNSLGDEKRLKAARDAVNIAKIELGERGPVWWNDGAPDLNRRMARSTCYAEWYEAMLAGQA